MSRLPRWLPLLPLLGLVACGEPDPAKINQRIDNGDYAGALDKLDSAIANSPTSPVYHLLAVRANLLRCAHEEGFCSRLDSLKNHVGYIAAPVLMPTATNPSATLSLNEVLDDALPAMAHLPQQPQPWLNLLKAFPANRRDVLNASLFDTAASLVTTGDVSSSSALLAGMANLPTDLMADDMRSWAGAMGYMLAGNDTQRGSYFIAIKSQKGPLPREALEVAPPAVYADMLASADTSTTLSFVLNLSPTLAGWHTPLLQDANAGAGIADGINKLRTSQPWLAKAISHWPGGGAVVTDLSPSVPLSDPGVNLQLALAKLSLLFNPNQPQLLIGYVNLASQVMQKTGQTDLMSDLSFENLPPATQAALVDKLFGLLESQQAAGRPLAPLLLPLASLKLDKTNNTRLEKLLQTALEQAIANKQASVAMAIAASRPTLAQNNRQVVAPLLVDDIRAHLKAKDFSTVTEVASFLTSKLGVSFNLDTLILEGLANDLKEQDVAKTLSANDAGWLLKNEKDAAFDLGPYWHFVQEHFASKPSVINNQLRGIVASAGGAYGPATAMWRLAGDFEASDFSDIDRVAYTNKAIQSALLADTSLAPGPMLELAGRLTIVHPDLPLAPVVEAALGRATTLDDSRAIWGASSPAAREVITGVRPQFAAFMRGVDAYNAHRLTAAANEFSRISDGAYREQLMPYFDDLQSRLLAVTGLYASTSVQSKLPTSYIAVAAPALTDSSARLSDLSLLMVNRLGTQTEANTSTLTSDHAAVHALPLATTLDFGNNTALLSSAMNTPSNLPQPLTELLGPIQSLSFNPAAKGQPASLLVRVAGRDEPVKFARVQANPSAVLFPQGRYLLTTPVTSASALLPPGTMLEVATENVPSGMTPGVFALQAQLRHPGMNTPQDLDGRFNSTTHVLVANFKAPLKQGGTVPAALKCQLVGNGLVCGAHYLNQPREAYVSLIAGEATRETIAGQAATLQAADDSYVNGQHGGGNPLLSRLKVAAPVVTSGSMAQIVDTVVTGHNSETITVKAVSVTTGVASGTTAAIPVSVTTASATEIISATGKTAPIVHESEVPEPVVPAAMRDDQHDEQPAPKPTAATSAPTK
jgi:hypothetical protein